jgi:hypothetical protein
VTKPGAQRVREWRQSTRMSWDVGRDASTTDAIARQPGRDLCERGVRARDDDRTPTHFHGDLGVCTACRDLARRAFRVEIYCQHPSGSRELPRKLCLNARNGHRVLEEERTADMSCGNLADAVSNDGGRLDATVSPGRGKREAECDQRRPLFDDIVARARNERICQRPRRHVPRGMVTCFERTPERFVCREQ